MYIDIFYRLRDAVRRKRPGKYRANSWCLFNYNAPAHRSVSTKDFLAKKNSATKLKYPPYSPNLAYRLIFTCFNWNRHLRDGAFVMLLTSLRMRRKSWTAFTKWLPGTFSTPLQPVAEECISTSGLFGRKCVLNVVYFSEIKWFWEQFEATEFFVII
jgi:hypothetical protein